jgi:hypothetical protein
VETYYFNYLKQQQDESYIDDLKYELDRRVYHYGDQFRKNNDNNSFNFSSLLKKQFRITRALLKSSKDINDFKNIAINNAYFSLKDDLRLYNYTPLDVPWICSYNKYSLYISLLKYQNFLDNVTYDSIISSESFNLYKKIHEKLLEYYSSSNVKILCLYNDMCSFEKMSIKIFKKLNKPSYVFLHGIPGRYNNIDENRTDFLVVWGKKIKENFVKAGIDEKKILISGHPSYKKYDLTNIKLRTGLDNILVLSKSMFLSPQGDKVQLTDRGNLILYLLEIEEVLKRKNVQHVKFRPHPSENINWYYKFISRQFFRPDVNTNITESFKQSSLVIGSTSTSFLNSLMNNVNYIIYEPSNNNNDYLNFPLNPPFDNKDERAVVANTKEELFEKVSNGSIVNKDILLDYIDPNYNLDFLKINNTILNK